MATGFNIRDVDPDAFISDQRQGEGKGSDRGMSLKIIDEVLKNSKGLFEENGLGDDIANKLKQLWISKLEAFDEGSNIENDLPAIPSTSSKKSSAGSGYKKTESISKLKHRKKCGTKTQSLLAQKDFVTGEENEDILASLSLLGAPKSISSRKNARIGGQVDGPNDTSDEEEDIDNDDDDDDEDDDDDDDDEDEDEDPEEGAAEEEPLGSGDDISEEDPSDLFNTENVVVCQYDKITRARNKWKFHLKDGIMNLNGKDYVFQRANGDAEW